MKFTQANSLKWIKVILFLCTAQWLYGQQTKLVIDLPILSYDINSHYSIKNSISNDYHNEYFIPNLRLGIKRNHFYGGFEVYSSLYHNLNLPWSTHDLMVVTIETYSLLTGVNLAFDNLSVGLNIGASYNNRALGTYKYFSINEWETKPCYGFNTFSPLVAANLRYKVWRNISIGLNLRFNPMLKSYQNQFNSCPPDFLDHDRIHYGVGQLTVGYDLSQSRPK